MSDYAENAIDATIAHQPSPGERFYPAFEVTPELDAAASEYVTHYPEGKQKSAVLPILHEIQKKFDSKLGPYEFICTGDPEKGIPAVCFFIKDGARANYTLFDQIGRAHV